MKKIHTLHVADLHAGALLQIANIAEDHTFSLCVTSDAGLESSPRPRRR